MPSATKPAAGERIAVDNVMSHGRKQTEAEFPGGAKAGWRPKCVRLALEAKGIVVRKASRPLRRHPVK